MGNREWARDRAAPGLLRGRGGALHSQVCSAPRVEGQRAFTISVEGSIRQCVFQQVLSAKLSTRYSWAPVLLYFMQIVHIYRKQESGCSSSQIRTEACLLKLLAFFDFLMLHFIFFFFFAVYRIERSVHLLLFLFSNETSQGYWFSSESTFAWIPSLGAWWCEQALCCPFPSSVQKLFNPRA